MYVVPEKRRGKTRSIFTIHKFISKEDILAINIYLMCQNKVHIFPLFFYQDKSMQIMWQDSVQKYYIKGATYNTTIRRKENDNVLTKEKTTLTYL